MFTVAQLYVILDFVQWRVILNHEIHILNNSIEDRPHKVDNHNYYNSELDSEQELNRYILLLIINLERVYSEPNHSHRSY